MVDRDKDGVPKAKLDAAGKPVPFLVGYPEKDEKGDFLTPPERRFGGRCPQLGLGCSFRPRSRF